MKNYIRAVLIATISNVFLIARPAAATSPITIDGVVKDSGGALVAGTTVVAWCGDISHLGGSNLTDVHGHYLIHTDSDDCPLGSELTITTDVNNDGFSDGAAHTSTHSLSTVSIILGSYTTVAVPEFGLIGASLAIVASGAILFLTRRRLTLAQKSAG